MQSVSGRKSSPTNLGRESKPATPGTRVPGERTAKMVILISILNVVAAIVGGRALFRMTRNYVIWLFEFVFVLFFAARPLLNGFFGLPDPSLLAFKIDEGAIVTYASCGLVFAAVFHPMVYWLFGRRQLFSDHLFYLFNFENVGKSRFVIVFISFIVLTYLLNAFKFHSLNYVFMSQDAFEAGVNLAGGLYFVQMMSSVLIFPCLVLLAKSIDAKQVRLACILLVTMAGFTAIVHPSERTGIIAMLVAVVVYKFSFDGDRVRLIKVVAVSIGAALLVVLLMVFLNVLRSESDMAYAGGAVVLPIVGGVWADTVPASNGMILIDYLRHHDWLYFRYLLLSMLPTTVIPSAIFPFKPHIDMEAILTYKIFGANLDPTEFHVGSTLSYTVPVAGYADLGYIGVIVAAVLYAIFFAAFLRGWKSNAVTVRFMTLYFLIFVVAGFRLSILGLVITSYWILISTLGLRVACYSMSSSGVKGHEIGSGETREAPTMNKMFVLCAFLVVCILCLICYTLTS